MRSWEGCWDQADDAGTQVFVELGPAEGQAILNSIDMESTAEPVPLNSSENRVFRVVLTDGPAVLKIYRYGGAPIEARRQQLDFVDGLADQGIRVARPRRLPGVGWVGDWQGQLFAIFEWCDGDDLPAPDLAEAGYHSLGADIARIHGNGSVGLLEHQLPYTPDTWGRECREFLLRNDVVYPSLRSPFEQKSAEVLRRAGIEWPDDSLVPIHSDLGFYNVLWPERGGVVMIDFDDLGIGSPFQDLVVMPQTTASDRLGDAAAAESIATALREGYRTVRALPDTDESHAMFLEALRGFYLDAWAWSRRYDRHFRPLRLDGHTKAHWARRVAHLDRCLEVR